MAVEYANRESQISWREFLLQLKARGLTGVQVVVSDAPPGLKAAIQELLPEVWWRQCYVHFLRNALDYLPRKADDDCLQELHWMYERRNVEEARRGLETMAGEVERQVSEALRVGGDEHRREVDVLPAAAGAPQTFEKHESA